MSANSLHLNYNGCTLAFFMSIKFAAVIDLEPHDSFIVIKEKSGSNGNFLIVNLLKLFLNQSEDSLTILVCFNQIFYHYWVISKKYGFDLSRISEDKFKYFEFCNPKLIQNGKIDFSEPLDELRRCIVQSRKRVNVIFDDLTQWKYQLSSPLSTINTYLVSTILPTTRCILLIHVENESDEIMANYFAHQADIVFETYPLETGFDRNISGVLRTIRKDREPLQSRRVLYHYKLCDRTVKFYLPGQTVVNFQIA